MKDNIILDIKPNEDIPGRRTKFTLILGYNGCGKSTIAVKLMKAALKNGGSGLIVTPDPIEWRSLDYADVSKTITFKGFKRTIFGKSIYRGNEIKYYGTLAHINKNFKSGAILFDDCRPYIGYATQCDISTLNIRRRQMNADIFATGHGVTQVPPEFFTFASDFILFQTWDKIDRKAIYIQDYDIIAEMQERVNTISSREKNIHYFEHYKRKMGG